MRRLFATARYERDAKRLLNAEEQTAMEKAIVNDPQAHPVIPGLAGIRKARWARKGSGKSGGVRTIYFHFVSDEEVYMLFMYAKNDQRDLTPDQKKELAKQVETIKDAKKKRDKEPQGKKQ